MNSCLNSKVATEFQTSLNFRSYSRIYFHCRIECISRGVLFSKSHNLRRCKNIQQYKLRSKITKWRFSRDSCEDKRKSYNKGWYHRVHYGPGNPMAYPEGTHQEPTQGQPSPQVPGTFPRENKLSFCLNSFVHFEYHIWSPVVVIVVKTYIPAQLEEFIRSGNTGTENLFTRREGTSKAFPDFQKSINL